jgi:hypothetical protein
VTVFLGSDVADELVEWPIFVPTPKIERLERVVHQRGHLSEFSSHQFLDGSGGGGVRSVRFRQVHGELIEALNIDLGFARKHRTVAEKLPD